MKPYFICEAGINHSGNLDYARQQIDVAKEVGASVVKFQHYDALKLLGKDSPYLAYASQCQIGKAKHEELASYCQRVGIAYAVSVFDIADLEWAASLSPFIKVASRMNKDQAFVEKALSLGKPVVISVQERPEIHYTVAHYMWCVTKYPASWADYSKFEYNDLFGMSSHCPSIEPSILAAHQGARLFENHLTLDRNDEGCDHPASVEPTEYARMLRMIEAIEINDIG
jgi:sialic acid synthase SpsE